VKRSLATALALLSFLTITARAQSFDIKTHTLKNGMKDFRSRGPLDS